MLLFDFERLQSTSKDLYTLLKEFLVLRNTSKDAERRETVSEILQHIPERENPPNQSKNPFAQNLLTSRKKMPRKCQVPSKLPLS